MSDPTNDLAREMAEDLARELAEDRAIELCPANELPAWPPSLLDHLNLLADLAAMPSGEVRVHSCSRPPRENPTKEEK